MSTHFEQTTETRLTLSPHIATSVGTCRIVAPIRKLPMARKRTGPPLKDAPPIAFLHRSKAFLRIANTSYGEYCSPPTGFPDEQLVWPLLFLYAHAVELALKAFLLAKGEAIEGTPLKTHQLAILYSRCRMLGLSFNPSDTNQNESVMHWLDEGNQDQGFRYMSTAGAEPEVWLGHDVANRVVEKIAEELKALDVEDNVPVRLMIRWGGPRPK